MRQPRRSGAGDPLLGRCLGDYQIEEVLRCAAGRTLYRARQIAVDREVAIKVLDLSRAEARTMAASFLAEARTAARLRHPGLVEVHDVCQHGDYLFYSMEYLPGGTLAKRVERDGPLSWDTALGLLREAAEALLYGERQGVVHGRISPQQILFARNGNLKILNLGLLSSSSSRTPEIGDAESLGEAAYRASEILRGGRADHRSDVYSLGCTFWFALTGRVPFLLKSREAILEAKAKGACPGLRGPRPSVSVAPAAGTLLARMTAPDPEARLQSFQELLMFVDRARARERPSPGTRSKRAGARRGWRRAARSAAIIAGAAASLVIAFYSLRGMLDRSQGKTDESQPRAEAGTLARPVEEARLQEELSLAQADLAQGKYSVAASRLESLPLELRTGGAVKDHLAEIDARARAELEQVKTGGMDEARRGGFRQAEQSLQELSSRLPAVLRGDSEVAMRSLREARDAFELEEGPRIAAGAWRHVAALGFDAALEAVAAGSKAATGTSLQGTLARLREQILGSKGLWEDIQSRGLPEWKDLRQRFEKAASTMTCFADFRAALLEAAVRAYVESMEGQGIASCFRGNVAVQDDEQVAITYDFSLAEQLEDFRPVGGGQHSLAVEAGRLKLRGEYRLLDGDPFVGPLSIDLVAPEPDPKSPNINVALWTAENRPVTAGLEEDSPADFVSPSGRSVDAAPGRRHLIFGRGYRPVGHGTGRFRGPGNRPIVFPADVLLVGVRGKTLSSDPSWRCLWGKSLLDPVPKSQAVEIHFERDRLVWRINKVDHGLHLDAEARRRVQEILSEAPTGSITLFTNGGMLTLDSLRITGKVRPEWSAAMLRRHAIETLGKKAGGIPWQDLDRS